MPDPILEGRTVVLTGATSGIGRATALALARQGATIVVVARDADRGRAAADEARAAGAKAASSVVGDLESVASVREAAKAILAGHDRIDVLVNNAGAMFGARKLSADGHELTLATNHLGPYLLTRLLEPALARAGAASVIGVSSHMHREGRVDFEDLEYARRRYDAMAAYRDSKLLGVLFVRELARRWQGRVAANVVHPGVVATNIGRNLSPFMRAAFTVASLFMLKPEQASRVVVNAASAPELNGVSGKYFDKSGEAAMSAAARDDALAARVWETTAALVGLPA